MVLALLLRSGQVPLADAVALRWPDDGTAVDYWTLAPVFDPVGKRLWLVDNYHERLLGIADHTDLTRALTVDLVLGQPSKSEKPLYRREQLRVPRQRSHHVYLAADLAAARGLFPNLTAKKVFNRWLTPDFERAAECGNPSSSDRPFSPVSVAFDSTNRMIVANDGYYPDLKQRVWKQLYLYNDPLTRQKPDATVRLPMGAPGDLAFDDQDRLIAQDHTWPRVWMIDLDEKDSLGMPVWLAPVDPH